MEDKSINTFNKVNYLFYLAKNKKISRQQFIDSIKIIPNFIAVTTTVYVNNSSFKNMQSSGLLSYVEEGALKNTLATYYEVDFKAIEAANDFFDKEGISFNNYLPIGLGKYIRESQNLSKDYLTNSKDGYENFMLSLDKTKDILQSDEFIYEVQKYYNFIFYYRVNVFRIKKSNDALLKLLRSEIH
jgi:hypothetical protein